MMARNLIRNRKERILQPDISAGQRLLAAAGGSSFQPPKREGRKCLFPTNISSTTDRHSAVLSSLLQ